MRIAVTGSIATDHLMAFPGKFADQLVADQLENVSLSFLVDELEIRKGGVAANIAFGLGSLGMSPVLVGAVGADFEQYRTWLEDHGVDTKSVHVSQNKHTARFVCTTDQTQNQIASFYPGAMAESSSIELGPIADRTGGLDLVIVSPNDPDAMVKHTEECRAAGYPFAADPSQQLARLEGETVRTLVEGASYLFTNEYETALLKRSTGWSHDEVLQRVGTWVMTHGGEGVVIESTQHDPVRVSAVPDVSEVEPTGVGDAFRSGFLWGLSVKLPTERAAQVGSTLASFVLETIGTQEYVLQRSTFSDRVARAYGADAAAEIESKLRV
ncbi:carbohydrate kinase family protein [Haloechinothrix sp. LS1_15]|uniref:carbohydrate kinase family protein n=1 Tax=Haloechinothrix sp. LS1_15 TaxID=2652248 RepID=UPI002947E0A2|nr:carbohydrate kinase family protein [Haloechinothrix sp. LS1_15]MDV6011736.1 carbohydrate kinase family protein [Haloechinothrix sp. LS1_15]